MPDGFYVTVIRNPGPRQRVGLLLGPHATQAEAEEHLPAGRQAAVEVDPWAAFDSFGVTRLQMPAGRDLPAGVLNDRLPETSSGDTGEEQDNAVGQGSPR